MVLEVQSADGSDPEMIRGLCRAVCWPSLLLEGVEIEADLGRGTSRVAELAADAGRGLFRQGFLHSFIEGFPTP